MRTFLHTNILTSALNNVFSLLQTNMHTHPLTPSDVTRTQRNLMNILFHPPSSTKLLQLIVCFGDIEELSIFMLESSLSEGLLQLNLTEKEFYPV